MKMWRLALAAGMMAAVWVDGAAAQQRGGRRVDQGDKQKEPERDGRRANQRSAEVLGGILTRTEAKDLTLRVHVTVRLDPDTDPKTGMPVTGGGQSKEIWDFTSAAVVFPVAPETATMVPSGDWSGVLKGNDRVMDEASKTTPEKLLRDYHSGTRLGKWTLREWRGEEVSLEVELGVSTFNAEVDEQVAKEIKWPDAWPALAQSTLQPQAYIDLDPTRLGADGRPTPYDMAPVKSFIDRVTGGKDPKQATPYVLAKLLAGELVRSFQLSGDGFTYARTGQVSGLDVQGAPAALERGRGSPFDMVSVLTAVYRQAGLPARMVIGYDTGSDGDGKFLGSRKSGELKPWVEFALVGKDGKVVWIPVDVVQIRKSSPRPPSVDRKWKHFGEVEFNRVIPFSFHFHPPTTVVSHGSPAFWGWLVTPEPPKSNVMQSIRFNAITTARRAGDVPGQKREREEKK